MMRQTVRLELYLTTDLDKVWTESIEEDISSILASSPQTVKQQLHALVLDK